MTSSEKAQTPLEALVVAQLAAIRKRESELHRSLQSAGEIEPRNVASEVLQLQSSADRLSRMMDAMNFSIGDAAFAG